MGLPTSKRKVYGINNKHYIEYKKDYDIACQKLQPKHRRTASDEEIQKVLDKY